MEKVLLYSNSGVGTPPAILRGGLASWGPRFKGLQNIANLTYNSI